MLPLLTLSQIHRGHYPRSENVHMRIRGDAQLRADPNGRGGRRRDRGGDEGERETKTRGGRRRGGEGRAREGRRGGKRR